MGRSPSRWCRRPSCSSGPATHGWPIALLLVLTPLCLVLAMGAVESRSTASRTRALLVLALVGGLCWWINLLFTAVLAACALTLVLRRPRLGWAAVLAPLDIPSRECAGLAVRGRPRPASHRVGPARPAPGDHGAHGRDLLANALPLVIGVPHAALASRALTLVALGAVGAGVVLALGDCRGDRTGRLLLGLTTAIPLAAVLVTERGQTLATEDPRYLLPVLAILPVLLGGALARVARHRPRGPARRSSESSSPSAAGVAAAYPALRSVNAWGRRALSWRARRLSPTRWRRAGSRLSTATIRT